MLKKLMKYEWKSIWRVLAIINAFTVIVTIPGYLAMKSLVAEQGKAAPDELSVIILLLFMLYYATIIGVSIAMMIYVGIRFYRNLFTDEGYLMHTLPVTKRQLVLSKLIVHSFCLFITGILVLVSVFVLLLPLLSQALDPASGLSESLSQLSSQAAQLADAFPSMLLCCITAYIIGDVSGVLAIYCAVTLGQTFQKHKVMGAILCYIGIYFLLQALNSFLMMPQMIVAMGGGEFNIVSYTNGVLLTGAVSSLFTGIGFYLVTLRQLNRRLNLN